MSKFIKKAGRAFGKIVKTGARIAAAYYTGGASELLFAQKAQAKAQNKAMQQMSLSTSKSNSQLASALLKPQEEESIQAPDYDAAAVASASNEAERRRKARSSGRASTILSGGSPLGNVSSGIRQKQLLGA